MSRLSLPSPAKLNLFLHITGQRENGYHDLQTIFQLLDYGDTLKFERLENRKLHITPGLPGTPMQDNLIYKAATALQQKSNCPFGAVIQLSKRLPMGGGIGGGSSNAATTLLGLNQLWQTGLTLDELAEIGATLGADVPVFVRGQTAWAEGLGEKLTPVALASRWYLVLAPDCHVSTASIFGHKDLTRDTAPITVAAFFEKGGKNDCQPLVERLYPQVRDAVDWLGQHTVGKSSPAQLTGTGACIFASFPNQRAALEVFAKRPKHLNGFVAEGVNNSPLHQHLP